MFNIWLYGILSFIFLINIFQMRKLWRIIHLQRAELRRMGELRFRPDRVLIQAAINWHNDVKGSKEELHGAVRALLESCPRCGAGENQRCDVELHSLSDPTYYRYRGMDLVRTDQVSPNEEVQTIKIVGQPGTASFFQKLLQHRRKGG